MLDRFNEYLALLRSPSQRIAIRIDWLNEDESIAHSITEDVYDMSGSLSVQMQNGVRSTATLKLNNIDRRFPVNPNSIWFDQKVGINIGIYLSDGTPYYIPKGVFYVTNPQEAYLPNEKSLTLNLVDKWSHLDGSLFGNLDGIYQVPLNSNIYNAISALLKTDRGNGKPLDVRTPMLSSYYLNKTWNSRSDIYRAILTPFTSRIEASGTYADVILDLAGKMLAAHVYYSESGQLVVEPTSDDVSDETKPIQWEFRLSDYEYLGDNVTYDLEGCYNEIAVMGAVLNGRQAKGLAQNLNISSPTRIQLIGRKCDKPVIDENYYADELCQAYAEHLLKQKTILQKSITINSAPIPHLQTNKLVSIDKPGYLPRPERFLVSAYSIPLSQTGTMSITATNINELQFTGSGAPAIITPSLPDGTLGESYYASLSAIGDLPIIWSVVTPAGSETGLPDGLSLNTSTGVISGIPSATGAFTLRIRGTNSVGHDTKPYSITISNNTGGGLYPAEDLYSSAALYPRAD